MNSFDLLRAGGLYLDALERVGYGIEVSTDFRNVSAKAAEAGREFQMPQFDTNRTDHTQSDAFWVFLYLDGNIVGTVAAMLQGLHRESFSDFVCRTTSAQFGNGEEAGVVKVSPILDAKLSGKKLAYIGELNILKGKRGSRTSLRDFVRLAQVLAVMEWDVDWTYAFIPQRHIEAGLGSLYGFTQSLPFAQIWNEEITEKRTSSEWFVGSPRLELEHIFAADLGWPNSL
jgi:hypothetical protein